MHRRSPLVVLAIAVMAARGAAAEPVAFVRAHAGRVETAGIMFHDSPPGARAGSGPREKTNAFTTAHDSALRGKLTAPLQDNGTISFWFRTDQLYQSGTATDYFEQRLFEIDDLIAASFVVEQESVTLYVGWGKRKDIVTQGARGERRGINFDQGLRVILPEWPGPNWTHVAIHWNAPDGEANVYLNGTPYERPGARIEPWRCLAGENLTLHLGPRFALADFRISRAPLDPATLRNTVGEEKWGSLDRLLGVTDLGPLNAEGIRGELLYARTLDQVSDIAGWRMEGPAELSFGPKGMTMKSTRPNGPNGHLVHWIDHEFPSDYVIEFDFEVLTEHGLNILFFSARGTEAQDAFDPAIAKRDGTFIQYTHGDLNSYHISYFANSPNDPRSVANLRKNSGFHLLANGPVGTERGGLGTVHHALLIKKGPRIRMAVDGRTLIDFTDDGRRAGPILSGGKIGFRQMQWSATRYRNLKVFGVR